MAEIGDAFPRRDLGGSAENWGRHLEQRIVGLESFIQRLSDGASNTSRQIEGNTANVSRQIATLSGVVTDLGNQQSALQAQQEETQQIVTRLGEASFGSFSSAVTIPKPTSNFSWGPWVYRASLGTITPRTNRVLLLGACVPNSNAILQGIPSGRMGLATGTSGTGSTSPTGTIWFSGGDLFATGYGGQAEVKEGTAAFGVIGVTPGVTYTLRMAFRQYRFSDEIPGTTVMERGQMFAWNI